MQLMNVRHGLAYITSIWGNEHKFFKSREMEIIELSCHYTFYPFQNKHQIHLHLQSVKMLCAYKNQNKVKIMKRARLTRDHLISIIPSLWLKG